MSQFITVCMSLFALVLASCGGPGGANADPLRVFAAASLKGPLDQAVADYKAATGVDVRVSYAASSLLARQITNGAPADVFWSANQDWMNNLVAPGLVRTPRAVLGNRVVLAGPSEDVPVDGPCTLGRVVTARTDAVPLGQYTKAGLQAAGRWPLPAHCLIETDNARSALIAVLREEAVAGYLYASDAYQANLAVWATLPTPSPVVYPVAPVTEAGTALVDFLTTQGLDRFLAAGFEAANG